MLLAFLLLGIIPAAITLGVGLSQAREALLARHYASLGESIESFTQILVERLIAFDTLAVRQIERDDLRGLLSDPSGAFDRVAQVSTGAPPRWVVPGPSDPPPAALASQTLPGTGRSRLALLPAADGRSAEVWVLRPDTTAAGGAGRGSTLALRLNPAVLWDGADLQANSATLCALDAALRPIRCERPLPSEVLQTLASRPPNQVLGRVDSRGVDGNQASVFSEVFLKSRFDGESWLLVLTQPTRVAEAAERQLNQTVLPTALIALMCALLLALVAVRRTLGPLQSLTQATERLADRDFAHRVPIGGNNEFAQLGHSFNRMAEGLARQFDTLGALARIDQMILEGRPVREIAGIARDLLGRGLPGAAVMVAVADSEGWWLCRGDAEQRKDWLMPSPDADWLALSAAGGSRMMQPGESVSAQALLPHAQQPAQLQPVLADGALAGALLAARDAGTPLAPAEQDLIAGLAGRLAVGIAAARRAALLEVRANIDSLTGLPNRPNFLEQLGERLARAQAEGRRETVMFVDLDGFSHINDSLGHAAGDRMLGEVGTRLRATLGDRGLVARLGGDEFALALSAADDDEAEAQARRLVAAPARSNWPARTATSTPASALPAIPTRAATRPSCCAMPTWPCTGPRPRARARWPSTWPTWRPRRCAAPRWTPRSVARSPRASSSCTTSRWCRPAAGSSMAARR
jgi:diguanylate cyclase (GGDEF)-like protein